MQTWRDMSDEFILLCVLLVAAILVFDYTGDAFHAEATPTLH